MIEETLPTAAELHASYSPTPKSVFRGTSLFLRIKLFRLPRRILGIFILVAWVSTLFRMQGWSQTSPVYFLAPIAGSIMAFGDYILAGIGVFTARKTYVGKTVNFTFTADGYKIEEPGATTTVNWSRVLDVVLAPDGFLIRPNVHIGIWVPLASFTDATGGPQFVTLLKSAGVTTRRP